MRTLNARPDLRPFYFVAVAAGAVMAHIAAEFAAMGSDADGMLFSARHWYLGIAIAACAVVIVVRGRTLFAASSGGRDLKRLLHIGLDTLPFGGTGMRFYGLTGSLQLCIGMLTQIGEGCPFCGHDVASGVLGALLTVLVLALAGRAAAARMPSIIDTFIEFLRQARPGRERSALEVEHDTASLPFSLWPPPLFNRPPPPSVPALASF